MSRRRVLASAALLGAAAVLSATAPSAPALARAHPARRAHPRSQPAAARRPDAERRAGAHALHGLGHVLRLRRRLQRGDRARPGERAAHARPAAARASATCGSTSAGGRARATAAGQITVSPRQWPHGMAWLTRELHAAGFASASTPTRPQRLRRRRPGQLRPLPARTSTRSPRGASTRQGRLLRRRRSTARPRSRVLRLPRRDRSQLPATGRCCSRSATSCSPASTPKASPTLGQSAFASYTFGPGVGNSWRTDTDVGFPGNVSFADVLRNMDADAAAPQAAGPGHWNDPDYLAPDQGMSAAQFRTQLSMWSILAAPLMVSDDLTARSPREPRGARKPRSARDRPGPGRRAGPARVQRRQRPGLGQAAQRRRARGGAAQPRLEHAIRITTSAAAIGLPPGGGYVLRDVWAHSTRASAGTITATVRGDSTVLLRVSQTA